MWLTASVDMTDHELRANYEYLSKQLRVSAISVSMSFAAGKSRASGAPCPAQKGHKRGARLTRVGLHQRSYQARLNRKFYSQPGNPGLSCFATYSTKARVAAAIPRRLVKTMWMMLSGARQAGRT